MTVTSVITQILAHAVGKLFALLISFLAVLSAATPRGIPTTTTSTIAPVITTTTVVKSSGGHTVKSGTAPAPARHSPSTTTSTTSTTVEYAKPGDYSQAPADESTNYKFLSDYRWACAIPVTYSATAPNPDIDSTFDELHSLTGLRFVPTDDFANANIQISFVGDDWRQANPGKWGHTDIFQRDGSIVLAKVSLSDSLADPQLHTVIRHEFGHAMGLDHVDGNEVMTPNGADTYQAGDIAGLKQACK